MTDENGNRLFLSGATWLKAVMAYATVMLAIFGVIFRLGQFSDQTLGKLDQASLAAARSEIAASKNTSLIQEEIKRSDERHQDVEQWRHTVDSRMDRTDEEIRDMADLVNRLAAKVRMQPHDKAKE